MKKFEYYIYEYNVEGKDVNGKFKYEEDWNKVLNELNRLGNEGWELVSTTPLFYHFSSAAKVNTYLYTFKREIL